jgi:hypothetical protein
MLAFTWNNYTKSNTKKLSIFGDKSSSTVTDRQRDNATMFNDPQKTKYDTTNHNEALTRVRAGGYMVPPKGKGSGGLPPMVSRAAPVPKNTDPTATINNALAKSRGNGCEAFICTSHLPSANKTDSIGF